VFICHDETEYVSQDIIGKQQCLRKTMGKTVTFKKSMFLQLSYAKQIHVH